MIKASELRIGNFIYDDEGIISKVVGFKPFDYSVRCDEEEGCDLVIDNYAQDGQIRGPYDVDSSFVEPIPLTPEWLERCGFQFLDSIINGRYYVRWASSPSEIAWYPVGEYISINTSTGGEGEQPNYTELPMPHVKYIHQLQNIYFALTGEELTIKG